ncbi:hypothetical protein SAMN05421664_3679 [Chryseobacterium soldanellicola]|uniref:Lipoprotein n=1 Tax=Chryseobacterium soldanellicola TaxID=311333 RepID=A0A1H1GHD8_9FLAO|nr:hypothetical protein [Chryseobacterium soldanellicola]SDR12634.1 hypothetical protein SAMN05421664_3679 [Chryseobacterium soldanellicola]
MKILLSVLSLCLIISCHKETKTKLQNKSSEGIGNLKKDSAKIQNDSIKTVDDIKKEYSILNTLLTSKKLDSTSFNYNCDEREGEIVLYYQNKKLKIVKDFYSEHSHFSSSTKYFVNNDHVFFIFKEDTSWNFDGGTPEKPITKDDITEKRIYLQNGNAIQCLEKEYSIRSVGNNPDPDKITNKETKCDIGELMKNYQSILKNKDKKGEIKCL